MKLPPITSQQRQPKANPINSNLIPCQYKRALLNSNLFWHSLRSTFNNYYKPRSIFLLFDSQAINKTVSSKNTKIKERTHHWRQKKPHKREKGAINLDIFIWISIQRRLNCCSPWLTDRNDDDRWNVITLMIRACYSHCAAIRDYQHKIPINLLRISCNFPSLGPKNSRSDIYHVEKHARWFSLSLI
jgi:hypothetical protein